ncbi:MAG TPA: hypothetical protein DEB06_01610 [Phycisphaerales bacterium]|nr:hypothetical protein [Phycisphaerales bacterium]
MEHTSSAAALVAGSGLSVNIDIGLAVEQALEQTQARVLPGCADLVMVFASGAHAQDMERVCDAIGGALNPGALIGVTGESVLGTEQEVERRTALSVLAVSLPGTRISPFTYRDLPHVKLDEPDSLAALAGALGADPDLRGIFVFVDPFSVPAASLAESLGQVHRAVPGLRRSPVIGGLASASPKPGGNILVLNGRSMRHGAVGVVVRGAVDIDTLVSQGCRPIGQPQVVTGASRNVMQMLGGRRAMDVLRETVTGLSPEDRELLPNGLFLGRVINEYKPRFGRGDFLIRGVMGVDQNSGAIAVGDMVRTGQTIQFHLRDARTASEDLELLLAAQRLSSPPAGGVLFTCNGRGSRLFAEPSHDARLVSRTLAGDDGTPMPLAGFFAAGEIGPIGGSSFLHGHTAALAVFRPRTRLEDLG